MHNDHISAIEDATRGIFTRAKCCILSHGDRMESDLRVHDLERIEAHTLTSFHHVPVINQQRKHK